MIRPRGGVALPVVQVYGAQAAQAGQFLFVSAQAGVDPTTGQLVRGYADLDPKGRRLGTGFMAADTWAAPTAAQCWQAFRNLEAVLAAFGASPRDILRINMYVRQISELPVLNPVRSAFFAPQPPPPITNVEVRWLPFPGAVFQAEVLALLPRGRLRKENVRSRSTSQQVGNYELATRAGSLVVAAGVIAARNRDGRLIKTRADLGASAPPLAGEAADRQEEGVEVQATFLYHDLQRALAEVGGSFDDVVKLTFFLKDMRDLRAVERIHRRFFPGGEGGQPAVTVVGVDELGVHDFLLEIEMIADLGSATRGKERFVRLRRPAPLAPIYPQAGRAAGLLWTGAVVGEAGGQVPAGVRRALGAAGLAVMARLGPAAAATFEAYDGLARVLAADGLRLRDVVKTTLYMTDPNDLPAMEAVTRAVFPRNPPAVTVVGVPSLPVPGAKVQIEGVARRR